MSPEEQQFCGRTLEDALAWCLVWLMAPELGIGPFVVSLSALCVRRSDQIEVRAGRQIIP